MPRHKTVTPLTPEERKELLSRPISINTYGGCGWCGTAVGLKNEEGRIIGRVWTPGTTGFERAFGRTTYSRTED